MQGRWVLHPRFMVFNVFPERTKHQALYFKQNILKYLVFLSTGEDAKWVVSKTMIAVLWLFGRFSDCNSDAEFLSFFFENPLVTTTNST